ncbi:MAG: hypothetical protein IPO92_13095 [Saprospiraceae bacterium]|nr:hypothetical protein [Saprospiraceae bacterium]
MPLPAKLKGEGKELLVRLDNDSPDQIFPVYPDFKVETVEFDPDLWLAAKSTVINEDIFLSSLFR